MKIMITGASGLIGQTLVQTLSQQHELVLIGRNIPKLSKLFPEMTFKTWDDLKDDKSEIDLIIHLAGENIGQKFWSTSFKQRIIDSRVKTTEILMDWINRQKKTPRIFAANAVGYYGNFPHSLGYAFDETKKIDEEHATSFLQKVSFEWQNAWKNKKLNLNICWLRFGVVLKKQSGFLKLLWPSYYLGCGAVLGKGQQILSWIHWQDLAAAICWLIDHETIQGPVNLVSPYPISQQEFAQSFAKVLHRPLLLRLSSKWVKLLFGEMGDELLLSGQEVYPRQLLESGFEFEFPHLENALEQEYK